MEMSPQMIEILKRAKKIDKAAEKFDTGISKKSNTSGLMDTMGLGSMDEGYSRPVMNDVGTEDYNSRVKSSKLPPAIQKAMLENPIPQSDFVGVDENAIKELRGIDKELSYNETDEIDMYEKPVRRSETKRKSINEEFSTQPINIDESYLRKLIASEISKALPKIIENYFESRLVKENVQFKAGNTVFSGNVMPMPNIKGKKITRN